MPTPPTDSIPRPCERCSQPTRTRWLNDDGGYSPWCNFCITAEVLAHVGSLRTQNFAAAFARAIDSGLPEDARMVSLALRGLALMLHDQRKEET